LVAARPEPIRQAYLALHDLVLAAGPPDLRFSVDDADASVGYGAHQYGYNGWGMAAVTPYSKWVTLTFLAGAELPDPEALLQGNAQMRHVKVSGLGQVNQTAGAITALVHAAAARQ
jgi:hypothetical protein